MKETQFKTLPCSGQSDELDQSSCKPAGAVLVFIKDSDDGESTTQGSDQLVSQKIGVCHDEHGVGSKSWRKRPRKQSNPLSTYPILYIFSHNDDDHPKKSIRVNDETRRWWVTPKRPRTKIIRITCTAEVNVHHKGKNRINKLEGSKKIKGSLKPLQSPDIKDDEKNTVEKNKHRPKRRKVESSVDLFEPAETKDEFKDHISNLLNGSELKFVIKKKLFKTDIVQNNNRFSMPCRQLRTQDFLTTEEKQLLAEDGEIAVALVGPDRVEYKDPMVLKRWYMNGLYHYVLRTNWYSFTVACGFKEGDKVEAWSFRRENKLCFAIACV